MKAVLAVAIGGLLGSVARYKLGGMVLHHSAGWRFPLSTFVVNLLGCAVVGFLAGIAEYRHGLSPTARLLLITGFCAASPRFRPSGSIPYTCFGGTSRGGLLPTPF